MNAQPQKPLRHVSTYLSNNQIQNSTETRTRVVGAGFQKSERGLVTDYQYNLITRALKFLECLNQKDYKLSCLNNNWRIQIPAHGVDIESNNYTQLVLRAYQIAQQNIMVGL